jgi:putative nucleotidyltransferase with HDIG domain
VVNRPALRVRLFAVSLAAGTLLLALGLTSAGLGLNGPLWALGLLALFALAAEQQPVRLSSSSEVTVSVIPVLFAAVAFGPLAAMLVGAVGLLGDARAPYERWMIWTSSRALAGGVAGLMAILAYTDDMAFGSIATAVVLACVADALVDASLAAATIGVRGTGCWKEFVRSAWPVSIGTAPLYAPVMIMLVYAYREVSVWTILLFFAPAFAAHSLYRLYREQRSATDELKRANDQLEKANVSFASALVAALDARDRYTAGHSAAVAVYARRIAAQLGLSQEQQNLAHLCGLVHDIGKVGLPPGILEKPGPLTPTERRRMEQHSVIGERILSNVEGYSEIANIVRYHHERFDGGGYPDNLVGAKTPLISRILTVADAYDAMTSARPYRDAMPTAVALERVTDGAGTQFDPTVVDAFQAVAHEHTVLRCVREDIRADEYVESTPRLALVKSG